MKNNRESPAGWVERKGPGGKGRGAGTSEPVNRKRRGQRRLGEKKGLGNQRLEVLPMQRRESLERGIADERKKLKVAGLAAWGKKGKKRKPKKATKRGPLWGKGGAKLGRD